MFSNKPESRIRAVLEETNGNLDATIDILLAEPDFIPGVGAPSDVLSCDFSTRFHRLSSLICFPALLNESFKAAYCFRSLELTMTLTSVIV